MDPKIMPQDEIEHVEGPQTHQRHHHKTIYDRAAEVLDNADHVVPLTEETNRRVLRKIDLHILPIILVVYLLQFADKVTLSYASVFGLAKDAHLVGRDYSWLSSCGYLAQLVCQPIIAYILVKLPLAKTLSVLIFCWGVSLACNAAATNFRGMLVSRIFLGVFESGCAPAFVALTQMWWRRREQPLRLAAWYSMNGVVGMFGSLLTYGLAHIKSPLKEYQIIFLFFGLITIAFSAAVVAFLPDSPIAARFLHEDDKLVALERLRDNQQGVESREWRWDQVKEAFLDYKTYGWALMMFTISVPSGGISTFGPLIIAAFGYDDFQTILFNIPFGAVQFVAIVGCAWAAMKWKVKSPILACLSIPPIIGATILVYIPRNADNKGVLLFAYYIISVYPAITPMIYSWSAGCTAGETKKKVTTSFLFAFQCAGNVVGPQLYTTADAPLYHTGLLTNLALFVILIGLYAIQVAYLFYLNKRHAKRRVAAGGSAKIVDRSMLKIKNNDDMKSEERQEVVEHSLEDLTDWQNDNFVYTY